jgi:hypothetical protein
VLPLLWLRNSVDSGTHPDWTVAKTALAQEYSNGPAWKFHQLVTRAMLRDLPVAPA